MFHQLVLKAILMKEFQDRFCAMPVSICYTFKWLPGNKDLISSLIEAHGHRSEI
jgi:hypothetical protein